jgi:energy-coupling factor transporter ATP-binding protein EcfA2
MLTKIELQNFKCFNRQSIPLRTNTLIVGRNNAGKSTIVEALRLISISTSRYGSLHIQEVPKWLDIPRVCRGVSPSLEHQGFNFASVFHRYNEPPAVIIAHSETGARLSVYLGREERVHVVLKDPRGDVVTGRRHVQGFGGIAILPQISPLQQNETVLMPNYVRGALSSNLASRHFRNQLNLLYEESFQDFKGISEETWPGLQIQELKGRGRRPGSELELMVRNDDFVAEIAWMGHGLQMWLQTMWFLARSGSCDTVILDEPDVYMHADLQRKLIRLLSGRYRQVIVATHSIEMMSEVQPDDILIVDRGRRKAQFTTDLPAVQKVIDQIGGIHNIQLARLWDARRCLFVEGNEIGLLKQIQNILFPRSQEPIDAVPNLDIGGWGGWNYVIGSAMFMQNAISSEIATYCIFDSDFHTPDQILDRKEKATSVGINLHIWSRKEIENYLLVPRAIRRVIAANVAPPKSAPSVDQVSQVIFDFAGAMKDEVMDGFSSEFLAQNKAAGPAVANRSARSMMADWDDWDRRIALAPGKALFSKVSDWAQKTYGVSISTARLAKELTADEIDPEMRSVMTAIENREAF